MWPRGAANPKTTRTARMEECSLAVKIRLARHGAKKRPYYRVVVADGRMVVEKKTKISKKAAAKAAAEAEAEAESDAE